VYDRTRTHSRRRTSLASATPAAPDDTGNPADVRAASLPVGRYHTDPPSDAPTTPPSEDDRTSRERLGWQIRATRVLTDLLARAVRDGLPRILPAVGDPGGNLAGRCCGHAGGDQRGQFEAWRVAAMPRLECVAFSGVTYLSAVVKRYDGLVDIVVLADLFPDEEER